MYQYKVEIIIDSEDPYSKEELSDIIDENMLHYADNAPFNITLGDITGTEFNHNG
jgi:hypothetical protein